MTSVRLKLYEIMNNNDNLWDKARLLYACSKYDDEIILPSFASRYDIDYLDLIEKDNIDIADFNYRRSLSKLNGRYDDSKEREERIDQTIGDYESIWTENLISIQFNHGYLSVKSNAYIIKEMEESCKENISPLYSLLKKDSDYLQEVYIPFFTFTLPTYDNYSPYFGSGIQLTGNTDKNIWVLYGCYRRSFEDNEKLCYVNYTFNIY